MKQTAGKMLDQDGLPGELATGNGGTRPVRISRLTTENCRLSAQDTAMPGGTLVDLWLGAIGPLSGVISTTDGNLVQFTGAIHPAIVRHFAHA